MALRHIVVFRFHDAVDEATRMRARAEIQTLNALPGILDWRLEQSLDSRKGVVLVQNVLFEGTEALENFRNSNEHKNVGTVLSAVADWLIADYPE